MKLNVDVIRIINEDIRYTGTHIWAKFLRERNIWILMFGISTSSILLRGAKTLLFLQFPKASRPWHISTVWNKNYYLQGLQIDKHVKLIIIDMSQRVIWDVPERRGGGTGDGGDGTSIQGRLYHFDLFPLHSEVNMSSMPDRRKVKLINWNSTI